MPTLNEVPEVAKLLATILTGEPVTHGALAIVPLLAPNLDDLDWLTLEDLIPPSPRRGEGRVRGEADRARVTEVSEAGRVPFLQVANGADRPLLLLDGEELIGAKQNRILNTTVLVAAHTEVTIPASRGAGATAAASSARRRCWTRSYERAAVVLKRDS